MNAHGPYKRKVYKNSFLIYYMVKRELLLIFLFVLLLNEVSALGISPAIVEIDFLPGGTREITYSVYTEDPTAEIEVFAGGDLLEYVILSEKKLIGGGNFKFSIKFPDNIDRPGLHKIGIGAREVSGLNEDEFIGTKVEIIGVVKVNVPYPGKYVEIDLNIKDGNNDGGIPLEVSVSNKGKENLDVNAHVEFYENVGNFRKGKMVYDMLFRPFFLEAGKDKSLKKGLNTTDFKAGNYIAEAVVNYGDEVRVNRTFRIGSLFVNITNFTQFLPKKGIERFFIDVESKWNDYIESIYADINISNGTKITGLRTPPVDLNSWETKRLEGFLDTSDLLGEYKTNITLYYHYGEGRSSASGELLVFEVKKGISFIFVAIIGVIILIITSVIIFLVLLQRRKKRGRK